MGSAPSPKDSPASSEGDESLGVALLADVAGGGKLVVTALRASAASITGAQTGAVAVSVASPSAVLGQQMQRLQAETHSRAAPLLNELEASTKQVATLQARRETLSRELRAVESDLAAASAREKALQAGADEAQAVYEQKLQALLATHTSAAPSAVVATSPSASAATSEALATMAASLEARVAGVLDDVRRIERAVEAAFQPPILTHTDPRPQEPSALAAEVSGRVSASAEALAAYTEAEGRCLWALSDRVARGRARLVNLRAEEDAFRGLGMQVPHSLRDARSLHAFAWVKGIAPCLFRPSIDTGCFLGFLLYFISTYDFSFCLLALPRIF